MVSAHSHSLHSLPLDPAHHSEGDPSLLRPLGRPPPRRQMGRPLRNPRRPQEKKNSFIRLPKKTKLHRLQHLTPKSPGPDLRVERPPKNLSTHVQFYNQKSLKRKILNKTGHEMARRQLLFVYDFSHDLQRGLHGLWALVPATKIQLLPLLRGARLDDLYLHDVRLRYALVELLGYRLAQ